MEEIVKTNQVDQVGKPIDKVKFGKIARRWLQAIIIAGVGMRGASQVQTVEALGKEVFVQPMSAETNPATLDLTKAVIEIKSDPSVGNVEKVMNEILVNPNYARSLFPNKPISSISVSVSDANGNALRDIATKDGNVVRFNPTGELKSKAVDCAITVAWSRELVVLGQDPKSQNTFNFLNKLLKTQDFQPGARMYIWANQVSNDALGDGTMNDLDELFLTADPNPDNAINAMKLRRAVQSTAPQELFDPESMGPNVQLPVELSIAFEAELGLTADPNNETDLQPDSPDQIKEYASAFQLLLQLYGEPNNSL